MNEVYKKYIIEAYDSFRTETNNITDPMSVGWSNKHNQTTRFQVLLDIGIIKSDKVLDYGCGLGHMLDYINLPYYKGIDINPTSIDIAQRAHPDACFEVKDIMDEQESFEWVIGSGVFSFLISVDDMLDRMDKALEIARKGVAFNFLLPTIDNPEYFNTFSLDRMDYILDRLMNRRNNDFIIEYVTDYVEHDFTIYLNKKWTHD